MIVLVPARERGAHSLYRCSANKKARLDSSDRSTRRRSHSSVSTVEKSKHHKKGQQRAMIESTRQHNMQVDLEYCQ